MAAWDVVTSDFGSDETAIFGPRQETGSALYQVETLATISSKDADESVVPKVVTSVLGDLACVAVEQHLAVFRDLQHTASLGFESPIDAVAWSPDGSLLMVGDSQGMLLMYETETMEAIFSFMVVPEADQRNGNAFKKIIFQIRDDGLYDLYSLSVGGRLYVIRNLDLSLLADGVDDRVAKLMKILQFVNVQTTNYHTRGTHDIITTPSTVYTLGSGDNVIAVWEWSGDGQLVIQDMVGDMLEEDAGMVTGKVSTNKRYLILQDSNDMVTLWCVKNLVLLKQLPEVKVFQLLMLDSSEDHTNSLMSMKLVVMSATDDGCSALSIREMPSFKPVYSLQLSADSTLSQCIPTQEVLYVAEVCPSEKPGLSATVRFRCLTETNPQTRLYRILHKQRFDEAEKFARMFNLDTELVYKVKLSYILDQLSPWNVHKCDSDMVADLLTQLWDCLNNIKDDTDIAEKCMRAALPSFDETWKLLIFCKTRLRKSPNPDETLMTKLLSTEGRLMTYRYVYGSNKYRADTWEHFSRMDTLKECLRSMRDGNTHMAFTLWTRHQNDWGDKLTPSVIDHFLSEIPDQMTASDIQGWLLTSLIPHIGTKLPHALFNVVSWVIQKALNMELLEKRDDKIELLHGQRNALGFLQETHRSVSEALKLTTTSGHNPSENVRKSRNKSEKTLQPLQEMMTSLKHLCNLHNKYKCNLRLTEFLKEISRYRQRSVAFRVMLDKVVALELIVPTLERQIRPYMREHRLNEDQVFSKYIKDLLERTSNITSYTGESAWETKAIAVIDFIKGLREKGEAILEVMKRASPPLSNNVEQLIQRGLQLDHPIVKRVKEECHLLEVKKLMKKYGMKNICQPTRSKIQQTMYHILARDMTTCITDAVQLITTYGMKLETELYFFRLQWLVSHNRLEEYFDLLKSLTPELSLHCGRQIIILTQVKLDTVINDTQDILQSKRLFTEAAVGTARILLQDIQDHVNCEIYEEMRKDYSEMTALLALQCEYNKHLLLSQYRCRTSREAVLVSYLTDFFTSQATTKGDINYAKVYRLASLLDISLVHLHGQLAIKASGTGDMETAVKHCSKLLESDPSCSTAETLYKVALSFLQLCQKKEDDTLEGSSKLRDLSYTAVELASLALTMCSPERMSACLDLYRALSLCLDVSRQCEVGDYSQSVQSPNNSMSVEQQVMASEMHAEWNLTPMFKEESLVMTSSKVLPLTVNYLLAVPSLATGKHQGGWFKESLVMTSSKVLPLTVNYLLAVPSLATGKHQGGWFKESLVMTSSKVLPLTVNYLLAVPSLATGKHHGGWFKESLVMTSSKVLPLTVNYLLAVPSLTTGKHHGGWFKESLVMTSSKVLPLTVNYLLAVPSLATGNRDAVVTKLSPTVVQSMSEPLLPLLLHLRENSHLELAHRFASHTMSSLTQHVTQFDMGFEHKQTTAELTQVDSHLTTAKEKVGPLMQELAFGILTKIFNARKVDQNLGLSYIISQPHKVMMETLKKLVSSSGHNYKKLMALASVGRAMGCLLQDVKVTDMAETMLTRATWGHRLSKIKIDFKPAFQGTTKERLKILKAIALNDAADVSIITDYCKDFDLDVKEGLMTYIQHVLSLEMPLWEGACNLAQRRSRTAKARVAIRVLPESDKLEMELNKLLKQCNPYDYETIKFLLEELQQYDSQQAIKGLKLLEYISVYNRKYPPSEYEQQYHGEGEREELSGVLDTLPAASKKCVPFHPLMFGDPWKIITPELEDDSVSMWLPIAKVLKLSEDQIPLMAIQNMVRRHVKSLQQQTAGNMDKNNCDWSFDQNSVVFLDTVRDLLMSVSNCEMGLACATWLFKELPMGGEKVIALKGCVTFAEKWYKACDEKTQKGQRDKAQAAYLKFVTVFKRLSTERVLFMNDLAEPDILQLCSKPGDLIVKLYEHPSITASWDCEVKKPDINAVVKEISKENDLELESICFGLIKKWLPSVEAKQEAEDTMTFNFDSLKFAGEEPRHDDDDSLRRVMYIMKGINKEDCGVAIFNFINKDSETTNQCQVRGLQCLLQVFNSEDLNQICDKSAEELSEMMHVLLYLVELEKLHIQHSVETFEECNKEGLIMGVWRNHNHQKTGVLLVAALCQDYKVYDTQLWNNILTQMLGQGMRCELEQVLLHLCGVAEVWSVPIFVKVWQSVLSTPLTNMCSPLSDGQTKDALYYFNLLSRCPVVTSLDLVSLSSQFQNLDLPVCAAGCLLMSPTSPRQKVKDILDGPHHLEDIVHLGQLGLNGYSVKQIKEFVYEEIELENEYASISKHQLSGFIDYIITQRNIDGMLVFAVENNRLKEAGQLVQMYLAEDSEVEDRVEDYMRSHKEDNLLQAYLKVMNIETG
ncbi:kinetochore-associated protein 1-like [Haliotis rubra]|uniref:kinetochore-associated protein 1-like n=1 Tax=Haliotis rubra TaxID=36100 RepID=UPI001EE57D13|nr:kinetochore-associated protein 1-like [Haliotis rubra]